MTKVSFCEMLTIQISIWVDLPSRKFHVFALIGSFILNIHWNKCIYLPFESMLPNQSKKFGTCILTPSLK